MVRGCLVCGSESMLGEPPPSLPDFIRSSSPRFAGLRVDENRWALFECTGKGLFVFGAKALGIWMDAGRA
jgi:hypothetical protein